MNERLFLNMIEHACVRHGIQLIVRSNGWVLELRKDGSVRYIIGSNLDINRHAAAMIARDKAASSELLAAANIEHVEHRILKSSDSQSLNEALLASMLKDSDVVIKPIEGSRGKLVRRVGSVDAARDFIGRHSIDSWVASRHIDIIREIRFVVLDGEVCLAYAKTEPVTIDGLAFFNLSKGAKADRLDVSQVNQSLVLIAGSAVRTLGLSAAAVDMAELADGTISVLEINAAFSLMRYAKTNTATSEEVAEFYDRLVAEMFTA